MTTGEKLSKLRKDNNYTQEELAEIMGVSRQSISKWESDIAFPETEKLISLSKLYHCSIDYLLNEENNENTGKAYKRGKAPYNKKRLPLIIFTLAFYTIAELICLFYWFPVTHYIGIINGSGTYITTKLNIYQMAAMDDYTGANFFPLMLIFTGIVAQGLSVGYIFADSKGFSIAIKILNCVYSVFAFSVFALATVPEDTVLTFPLFLLFLSITAVIIQFAVTSIRKTR